MDWIGTIDQSLCIKLAHAYNPLKKKRDKITKVLQLGRLVLEIGWIYKVEKIDHYSFWEK